MLERPIRMVVTDLDDTLLSKDKTVDPAAALLIAQLKKQNIRFTFISGRPPFAIARFARMVETSAPIVGCNGAVVVDRNGQLLEPGTALSPDLLAPLLAAAVDGNMTVLALAGEVEYALAETPWTRSREAAGRSIPLAGLPQLLQWQNIYKINIMAGEQQASFAALLPDIRALQEAYSIALYGHSGCEIVNRQVGKETGLRKLCQMCQIPIEEVLAIGDNENDIQMLRAAGIGAAVANATDSVKAAADYCCEYGYTEGVMEAIQQFALR